MMTEYEFIVHFQLPTATDEPETYLDALFEAGCDDASIGVGLPGAIALDFSRTAESAAIAVASAIEDALKAIPGAILTEVGPDLLNTSEIADTLTERTQRVTRQAMRKYTQNQLARLKTRFPAAAITGTSPMWHFGEVLNWMVQNNKLQARQVLPMIETSRAARAVNTVLHKEKNAPEALIALTEQLVAHQSTAVN